MKLTDFGCWVICCPSSAHFKAHKKLYFYKQLPEGWTLFGKIKDGEWE